MPLDRLRNMMRMVAVALAALFGLLFFTMFQTLTGLEHKQTTGGAGTPAPGSSIAISQSLQEPEVLSRLLGTSYVVAERHDLNKDGIEEVLAYALDRGGPPGQGAAVMTRRALVLARTDRGWTTYFDTSSAASWQLGPEAGEPFRRALGLADDGDLADHLAQLDSYRIDEIARERLSVEPMYRGLRLPRVVFTWSGRHMRFLPEVEDRGAPAPESEAG